eukprot:TRINITY_DN39695_c0_g1_i1.p1 TRINITY_DN39695_c0_g1~~TRINITY_DN39695_c0_g1_i1.p1  ORF type:complete len:602 (-),score=69.45 TRINITY_DN39695_c0_g1_i1:17-1822(-)
MNSAASSMLGLFAASVSKQPRHSRNPFDRSDRIAFPAFTQATWDCPEDDSFGTPRSDTSYVSPLSRGQRRSGWTPGTADDLSWQTRTDERSGQPVDGFFAERERRGLLTPAGTPSDVMQRGPLFDPDASGSSKFSSRRCSPATPAGPSPEQIGKVAETAGCEGLGVPASWSKLPVFEKEHGGPESRPSQFGQPPSSEALPQRPPAEGTGVSIATLDAASRIPLKPKAYNLGAAAEASTRETDSHSLSTSSISFGREDPRMRFGDVQSSGACSAAPCATAPGCEARAPPLAAAAPSPAVAASQRSGSVARQLDFGCMDAAAVAAGRGSPCPHKQAKRKQKRNGQDPCSQSTGDFVWDSSLSREIPSRLCLSYSPSMVEFSPLRSLTSSTVQSWPSPNLSHMAPKAAAKSPADEADAQAPSPSRKGKTRTKKHGTAPPVSVSQLLKAVQTLGTQTPGGDYVLQLRLCRCGSGLCLSSQPDITASEPCSPASAVSRSPGKRESLKQSCSTSFNGSGPIPRDQTEHHWPSPGPAFARSSSVPPAPRHAQETSFAFAEAVKFRRRFSRTRLSGQELSLDELKSAVSRLQLRCEEYHLWRPRSMTRW